MLLETKQSTHMVPWISSSVKHRVRHNLVHLGGSLYSQSLGRYWKRKQFRKIHKQNTD